MNFAQERLLELLSYGSSRQEGDTTEFARQRASWTEGDWNSIADEALRHELGPLLHDRLRTRLPDQVVPTRVATDLRNTCRRSASVAVLRSHLLARALGALNEAGVQTIVLKGAYLSENFYGNPALRPMSDVDILVHPEDLGKANVALSSDGTGHARRPHPNFVLFMGRARWRDKLRLLIPRVFPSRKMIAALYPVSVNSPRVFLYYPLSIWSLVKRNKAGLKTLLSRAGQTSKEYCNAAALMDWMLTPEESRSAGS